MKWAVLISGGGTNLQALIDAVAAGRLSAELGLVVSNRADAGGLARAAAAGIPTAVIEHKDFASREEFDKKLVDTLKSHQIEWIALAGFMRVLTPIFLNAFAGKIVNIHPSLLPSFPGIRAQEQAFESGVKVAGCTVHFVDNGVDTGPIIAQRAVEVVEEDTVETLRQKILAQEHEIFPAVIHWIDQGFVTIDQKGTRPIVRLAIP
ncbi:MAG: phosphoribosylglycinamide formyltransferase [Polyangiaceae bacterium]|nr:phosphoribosylglycinamide formyltransferase [Polyangiaceae bacterium]